MISLLCAIAGIIVGFGTLYFILRVMGRKRTIKTLDVVLVIVYVTFIVYNGIMIWMYWRMGSIPETLAVCVNSCLIGEVGCTTRITNVKTRREIRREELEDRKEANHD